MEPKVRNLVPNGGIKERNPSSLHRIHSIPVTAPDPRARGTVRNVVGRIATLDYFFIDLPREYKILLAMQIAQDPMDLRSIFTVLDQAKSVLGDEITAAITAVFPLTPPPQEGLPKAARDPSPISPRDGEAPVGVS